MARLTYQQTATVATQTSMQYVRARSSSQNTVTAAASAPTPVTETPIMAIRRRASYRRC
ncbi:hypothetical protein [Nonomuraea jabiensis]|uniref:hypothetical protein n=1 Tax=Nonomuraea jabiensis TaxID=882448 RepID=UPI003D74456E